MGTICLDRTTSADAAASGNVWLATQWRSHRSPAKFPANREFFREFRRIRRREGLRRARNPRATATSFFDYVPSLYRLLLTAFLGLNYYGPSKPREPGASPYDTAGMLEYRFNSKQGDYEQALADILKPRET